MRAGCEGGLARGTRSRAAARRSAGGRRRPLLPPCACLRTPPPDLPRGMSAHSAARPPTRPDPPPLLCSTPFQRPRATADRQSRMPSPAAPESALHASARLACGQQLLPAAALQHALACATPPLLSRAAPPAARPAATTCKHGHGTVGLQAGVRRGRQLARGRPTFVRLPVRRDIGVAPRTRSAVAPQPRAKSARPIHLCTAELESLPASWHPSASQPPSPRGALQRPWRFAQWTAAAWPACQP